MQTVLYMLLLNELIDLHDILKSREPDSLIGKDGWLVSLLESPLLHDPRWRAISPCYIAIPLVSLWNTLHFELKRVH